VTLHLLLLLLKLLIHHLGRQLTNPSHWPPIMHGRRPVLLQKGYLNNNKPSSFDSGEVIAAAAATDIAFETPVDAALVYGT
jgi:hypothetical protein